MGDGQTYSPLISLKASHLLANKLIDEFILYQAPKLLGKGRKNFSKFGETNQKLSTIDFEINTITNLGQDKKIILTPNYK